MTSYSGFLRPYRAVILLLVLAPMLAGCFYSREISRAKRAIADELPEAHFKRKVVISVGPLSLGFARWVTGLMDDHDPDLQMARSYLKEVKRAKVGVYEIYNAPDLNTVETPRRLQDMLERDGWELAVRVREAETLVWVYYRAKNETVRDLFAVVFDDHELVIARVDGNLDRLIAKALSDHVPVPEMVEATARQHP